MSEENCSGSCSSCTADCASRQPSREELLEPVNKYSKVKRVIGVVSGKGGVGKSFVTSYLSVCMQRKGYKTAILDADITGPSIPKSFGVHGKTLNTEQGMLPAQSNNGTKIMSINLLVDNEETPVIWRGPVIAGAVKQFWTEVYWGDVDYMFVDMPPGTGDVPLTVFQSIPLDGIIIVTSPQELVSMIVKKAVNMATAMDIPILGIIENYSYVLCDCCGKKMPVFGESHVEEVAEQCGLKVLAKLPLNPSIAQQVDAGKIEELSGDWMDEASAFVEQVCPCGESEEQEELTTIAVTTAEDDTVFAHFGSCPIFTVFKLEDGKIVSSSRLEAGETGHEAMADLMVEQGVQVLICGGIGLGAIQALMEKNIMVVPGQQGKVQQVAEEFLAGTLAQSTTPTCGGHEDSDGCGCGCGGGCHS